MVWARPGPTDRQHSPSDALGARKRFTRVLVGLDDALGFGEGGVDFQDGIFGAVVAVFFPHPLQRTIGKSISFIKPFGDALADVFCRGW